jgi:hypothetical protein
VGYGGRQEVIDALRSLLHERAEQGATLADVVETITADDIARHLYTAGQPDPDLVIRTSGEQRLSNFLLWQSAYSELYFCEAYWPAFREIDFLRAAQFRRPAASLRKLTQSPDRRVHPTDRPDPEAGGAVQGEAHRDATPMAAVPIEGPRRSSRR